MAAISRRPRLTLCAMVILSLLAAACTLVKPLETSTDRQAHAAKLAGEGKHVDAARAYAERTYAAPVVAELIEGLFETCIAGS